MAGDRGCWRVAKAVGALSPAGGSKIAATALGRRGKRAGPGAGQRGGRGSGGAALDVGEQGQPGGVAVDADAADQRVCVVQEPADAWLVSFDQDPVAEVFG